VRLDPEEQIIAAALDQAALDEANERGAEARIAFLRDGYAKVTITISRELVMKAERSGLIIESATAGRRAQLPRGARKYPSDSRAGLLGCPSMTSSRGRTSWALAAA
jgi:hypothetical protein